MADINGVITLTISGGNTAPEIASAQATMESAEALLTKAGLTPAITSVVAAAATYGSAITGTLTVHVAGGNTSPEIASAQATIETCAGLLSKASLTPAILAVSPAAAAWS